MSYTHHYNVIENSPFALKISVFYLFIPPLTPPKCLATIDLFSISRVLPFPECRVFGIIQYVDLETGFFHMVIGVNTFSVNAFNVQSINLEAEEIRISPYDELMIE